VVPVDVARSYFVGVFIHQEEVEGGAHGKGAARPWVEWFILLYRDLFHPLVSGE
jgi:hypothetical protein